MVGHELAEHPAGTTWLVGVTRENLVDGTPERLSRQGVVSGAVLDPGGLRRVLGKEDSVYQAQLHELALRGATPAEAVHELAHVDAILACDQLRPTYERANGTAGFVSACPPPDPDGGTETAAVTALWSAVGRRNLLVAIPLGGGTPHVVTAAASRGINLHITHVSSVQRFHSVMDWLMTGLEKLAASGRPVAAVKSVVSLMTSTVDAEVNRRLAGAGRTDHGSTLVGCAGSTTANLALAAAAQVMQGARWQRLAAEGAQMPSLEVGHPPRGSAISPPGYPVRLVLSVGGPAPAPPADAVVIPRTLEAMAARHAVCSEALADAGVDLVDVYRHVEQHAARELEANWAAIREEAGVHLAAAAALDRRAPSVVKSDSEWRAQLTPAEYRVLREAATERAFTGEYTSETRPGTYSCRACGSSLFGGDAKFEAHCGWPTFFSPLSADAVTERADTSTGPHLTEVTCSSCHSHLGHVFSGEGYNTPTDRRYCVNSAALHLTPEGEDADR
jgi:peptide-methionine (R)-S-oxide reductase